MSNNRGPRNTCFGEEENSTIDSYCILPTPIKVGLDFGERTFIYVEAGCTAMGRQAVKKDLVLNTARFLPVCNLGRLCFAY
jgi:hypothetical protein